MPLENGQQVRVRRVGTKTWVPAKVEIISLNQKSLCVSAESGLSTPKGFLLNPEMAILLDGAREEATQKLGVVDA
jgi:hypothetical protein